MSACVSKHQMNFYLVLLSALTLGVVIVSCDGSKRTEFSSILHSQKFISPVGTSVNMNPLIKLEGNKISDGENTYPIKKLPTNISSSHLSYTFLAFRGNNRSVFNNKIPLLVKELDLGYKLIFPDLNGNLDFTDDGNPISLMNQVQIKIPNQQFPSSYLLYEIRKSKINSENAHALEQQYARLYPNSKLLPAKEWLVSQRLNLGISVLSFLDSTITVLYYDKSLDGRFTFNTSRLGDRIYIAEGDLSKKDFFLSEIQDSEPIDHNAVFQLFGKNYFVQNFSEDGNLLSIEETDKETRLIYADGSDVSDLPVHILNEDTYPISRFIKRDTLLLLDVGGTWCGACIRQEPTIRSLYNRNMIQVLGIFAHDTETSLSRYIKNKDIRWPAGLITPEFQEAFNIISYPTYILVNSEGKIEYMVRTAEELETYLNLKLKPEN